MASSNAQREGGTQCQGWIAAQLAAGGFARASEKLDPALYQRVAARRYRGGAVGRREVVRLTADVDVVGDDLVMEFFGVEQPVSRAAVGWRLPAPGGFVQWGLAHHPDQADFVLELSRTLNQLARSAELKPGAAWTGFQKSGRMVERQARQLLAAYWEEVARIFKRLDNTSYASRALSKSLEAEQVHALRIDSTHRRDTIVEFALGGCLTGKALGQYARTLQKESDPLAAYRTFRDLFVRRTLGGVAPTAGMMQDLIRLAGSSGLEADAEIEHVLQEIIASPAMSRTSLQFWKSVEAHARRIVARDKAFGMALLGHTSPWIDSHGERYLSNWCKLLKKWNVLELLWDDDLPESATFPGERANWIGIVTAWEENSGPETFDLIERMAGVLRREGVPIPVMRMAQQYGLTVDVDVLETFLALGIDVLPPRENEDSCLDFGGWLRRKRDHPRRRSSLEYLAGDERFSKALRETVETLAAHAAGARNFFRTGDLLPFEEAAAECPAIHAVWKACVVKTVEQFEGRSLVDARDAVGSLKKSVGTQTCRTFPDIAKRLQEVDLTSILWRTLQSGVLDEYGWTALDQADAARPLPAANKYGRCPVYWSFPNLAYFSRNVMTVVRPRAVDPPRELALQADDELELLLPVGEDVLVRYIDDASYSHMMHWLSDPGCATPWPPEIEGAPLCSQPWGEGIFAGGRVIHPGDESIPGWQSFLHDGERFWTVAKRKRRNWEEPTRWRVVQIDPMTGERLKEDMPQWFSQDVPEGADIDWSYSWLLPLPAGITDSPLGSRDGLIGWRVLRMPDGRIRAEGIDGRRVVVAAAGSGWQSIPIAMVKRPAAEGFWVIYDDSRVEDSETGEVFSRVPTGSGPRDDREYARGWPAKFPLLFWHLMELRDKETSRKLRQISEADAATLLDAALIEAQARSEWPAADEVRRSALGTSVGEMFPSAPKSLKDGIASIAEIVAAMHRAICRAAGASSPDVSIPVKVEARSVPPPASSSPSQPTPSADVLFDGLHELCNSSCERDDKYRVDFSADHALGLPDVIRRLQGESEVRVPRTTMSWLGSLCELPSVAWRCYWQSVLLCDADDRASDPAAAPWIEVLSWIATSGLFDLPGVVRYRLAVPRSNASRVLEELEEQPIAWEEGSSCYHAGEGETFFKSYAVIVEHARDGKPRPPKEYAVEYECDLSKAWNGERLQSFIAAIRDADQPPFVPVEQLEAAATRLGVTPIEVGLAWMGEPKIEREVLGRAVKRLPADYRWKVGQVSAAMPALDVEAIPAAVLGAPVRVDPVLPFGEQRETALTALVDEWAGRRSSAIRIPLEIINEVERSGVPLRTFQRLLDDDSRAEQLRPEGHRFEIRNSFFPLHVAFESQRGRENTELLREVGRAIRLINYNLPFGHGVRRALAHAIDGLCRYLDDPATVVLCEHDFITHPDEVPIAEIEHSFAKLLGEATVDDGIRIFDNGFVIAAVSGRICAILFRPARLQDADNCELLASATATAFVGATVRSCHLEQARVALELRGGPMQRIREVNLSDDMEEGCWDQDPRRSVPGLVAEVATVLGVEPDAAAYYLQILALPDPTNGHVRKWCGWNTKQIKQLADQLVAAGCVVEAKRSRAGRGVFLPGVWVPFTSPALPLERWKLSLFTEDVKDEEDEEFRCHLTPIMPSGPVSDLFVEAWGRVVEGDRPS